MMCTRFQLFTVYLFIQFIFLHCIKSDAIAYSNAHYGQGTGPILLDNLACIGTEYNLTSCSYDSDTSDCRHYEDAGVRCNTTCEYSFVCIVMAYQRELLNAECPMKLNYSDSLFTSSVKCVIRDA